MRSAAASRSNVTGQFLVADRVVEAVVPGRGPGAGQLGDAEARGGEARRARSAR